MLEVGILTLTTVFLKNFSLSVVEIRAYFVKCKTTLPNNKILDWSKLEAFADHKICVSEKSKFVLGRLENIVGKGENAGYQHFLLFPQCFQKAFLQGC